VAILRVRHLPWVRPTPRAQDHRLQLQRTHRSRRVLNPSAIALEEGQVATATNVNCLKRVQAQSSEIRGRHRTFLAGQEQGCGTSVRQQSHTCKFWSADLCASEQLPCPRRISAFTGMVAPAFDRNCSSRCMCKLLNLCHWGHSSRLWSLTRIRLSRAEPLLRPDWPA
jgi:hypothetical protein